jgi:hypothetical protein
VIVFATYTGAKMKRLAYSKNDIRVIMEDPRFRLDMKVTQSQGGTLMAPKNGLMNRKILESIHAVVQVSLSDRKGNLLFKGTGTNTGLEVVGAVNHFIV